MVLCGGFLLWSALSAVSYTHLDVYKRQEYNQEEINKALQAGTNEERKQIVKSQDFSGHGTAVAGVAAGGGSVGFPQYRGVDVYKRQ